MGTIPVAKRTLCSVILRENVLALGLSVRHFEASSKHGLTGSWQPPCDERSHTR